jgi:hypothetical protein
LRVGPNRDSPSERMSERARAEMLFKKAMTPNTTFSHQAPAGQRTADPTTAVRGPLAETEHQGAHHDEEDVEALGQAPGEEDYDPDEFHEALSAEEVRKRGVAFASAIKFIAVKYPDAKEAALGLLDDAVEKIVELDGAGAVVEELAGQYDIDAGLAHDLVSNLTTGEPKAGVVARQILNLLTTMTGTASPSPSKPTALDFSTTDAILAGIKALTPWLDAD